MKYVHDEWDEINEDDGPPAEVGLHSHYEANLFMRQSSLIVDSGFEPYSNDISNRLEFKRPESARTVVSFGSILYISFVVGILLALV